MSDMKHTLSLCLAAFTLAACTQDELAEQGAALSEGAYPLAFTAVQLPPTELQTRVADEGNTTEWEDNDQIVVSMGGKQAIYTYKGGTWSSDSPFYWESTTSQTVTAWYPVDETIDFTHQDQGLTYLMKGECEGEVPFNTTANLTFTHQLAKVRVLLDGEKASEVADVTVRSYPQSTNNEGELGGRIGDPVYVPMLKTEYEGKPCWEATLRDGYFEAGNTFRVAKAGGSPVQVTLAKDRIPVIPGEVTTITITVNSVVPDDATVITNATGDITDNGEYVVRGSDRTTSLNITGGKPTIYLDGATVSVGSGPAINITNNATPTIYVVGENNNITSNSGTGIYVEDGSTVTITGSSRNDELTVTSGDGYPGIGGSMDGSNGVSCGDINISNITVFANGSARSGSGYVSPGIGCVGRRITCGTITISNATVHAFGVANNIYTTPGIGCGFTMTQSPGSIPDAVASNSEIHAHRGSPGYTCDYIGWGADQYTPSITYANSAITPGAGSIKSSIVYCYTGENLDKTVEYDENGEGKEQ